MENIKTAKLTEFKRFLESHGLKMPSSMLSIGSDSKTAKGQKFDYLTGIVYLIPSSTICPASKLAACFEPCLVSSGLASVYKTVNESRLNKTKIFEQFPHVFYELVRRDIVKLQKKAEREGLSYCVRMNGTSDINHNAFIESMPHVQFYDYTKMYTRTSLPNYHLTFSYSGANKSYLKYVKKAVNNGLNIAVVFSDKKHPSEFLGLPVINGDDTDLRFLDYKLEEKQAVVALYAKGKAKKDTSGFVVQNNIITRET